MTEARHLSLDDFRDRLVNRLLYVLPGVGLLALAGSLTRVLDSGWRPLLWLHIGLYLALLITIALSTQLNSIARRLLLLGILLIIAIAGIAVYGLLSLGSVIFVAFCTLTSALLGTRAGLMVTVASALIIAAIGGLAVTGHHHFDVDPVAYLYSPTAWINDVTGTLMAAVLLVATTGFLLRSLESRHDLQLAAEGALARSEERLRLSQRYANIGAWDWDVTTGALYWSEEIGHLFGYGEAVPETTYENFLAAIHPDDRQRVIDAVNACVERDALYEIEHRVVWPDGSVHWLLERGGATRSANGEPLRMLGIVQDITERKQAAKSLTESEELFREFAENTEEVFWVRDLRSNSMIYVSPAYEKIWGRSCASLLANPLDFLDAVHPDDLNSVREGILHQQRGEYFNRDYRIIRTDGQIRRVHVQAFPIRNSAGVVYRIGGLARDITRQQEMEADRIRHERAQVQTLVREVHHRIKNHLQGVVGLLDEHAGRFPAAASLLMMAIMQIRSIALAHGLQGQGADAELHLCEIVPAVAQSVTTSLNTSAAIETRIDMDWSLRIADADTVPLALIFNELLINCLKHRPPDSGNRPVRLHLHERHGIGRLVLICPGARLSKSFDFEQGVGLGTGLELVKSLLPREDVTLAFRNDTDGVYCEMTLQAPVVLRGTRLPGNTP